MIWCPQFGVWTIWCSLRANRRIKKSYRGDAFSSVRLDEYWALPPRLANSIFVMMIWAIFYNSYNNCSYLRRWIFPRLKYAITLYVIEPFNIFPIILLRDIISGTSRFRKATLHIYPQTSDQFQKYGFISIWYFPMGSSFVYLLIKTRIILLKL